MISGLHYVWAKSTVVVIAPPENFTSLSRDELLALVTVWQRQVAALTAANDAVRVDLARLTRDGNRPAAPFSKGTRAVQPKRSGRQLGAGPFHSREVPLSAQIPRLRWTSQCCGLRALPAGSRRLVEFHPDAPHHRRVTLRVLKTPPQTLQANAFCERLLARCGANVWTLFFR